MPAVLLSASPVVGAETSQQSEQASLHGQRALTPMISGVVSGGTIGILWIVGLLIYIYRRYRGHQQVRSAGLRTHRELDILPPKPEAYILPPDPAIIQGFRAPGERVVPDDPRADGNGNPKHVRTEPWTSSEKGGRRKEKEKEREARPGDTRSAPQLPTLEELPSPTLSPAPSLPAKADRLSASRPLSPKETPTHDL
ncbi:uncharacterized protein C8Q71DRAFT_508460 [Rhodofomes roseus]|uniref:Uncharacterized protein n=1 Tax=Rhodofomes roseus TaxID=34475 RepID=A0ABQ8KNN5_9APHY|nr:uncharacterized protein C8Q71DRAFT_508460 [Rhodofomes roseus]KAH9839362.1 hypothetical protein C8Q71DRAFT_508460 [Rhodofomes roseus]